MINFMIIVTGLAYLYLVYEGVRSGRAFSLTVMVAIINLLYFYPQLYFIVNNNLYLPDEAIDNSLIFMAMCFAITGLIYIEEKKIIYKNKIKENKYNINLVNGGREGLRRLRNLTIFFVLFSNAIQYLQYSTFGGIQSYYANVYSDLHDWMGEEVIYAFFARQLSVVSIVMAALYYVRKRGYIAASILMFAMFTTILDIFILQRRSDLIFLVAAVGGIFVMTGYIKASLKKIIVASLLLSVFIVLAPLLRGVAAGKVDVEISMKSLYDNYINEVSGESRQKELNGSLVLIEARERDSSLMNFNLISAWAQTTIPRTIVGQDIKNAFILEEGGVLGYAERYSGIYMHRFMSISTPAILYADFGYIGFLILMPVVVYVIKHKRKWMEGRGDAWLISYVTLMCVFPHWYGVGMLKMPRELILYIVIAYVTRRYLRNYNAHN